MDTFFAHEDDVDVIGDLDEGAVEAARRSSAAALHHVLTDPHPDLDIDLVGAWYPQGFAMSRYGFKTHHRATASEESSRS